MRVEKITNRHILFTVAENEEYDVSVGLILGSKYNFVVDTGMGESTAGAVLDYLACDEKQIVVINTHAHADHVMGNWLFKENLIIAHVLCRDIMDREWDGRIKKAAEGSPGYFDKTFYKCLPNMVFENHLDFPEEGITLFHSPGHTADGISIYDSVDKVLYTGDNFGVFGDKVEIWTENHRSLHKLLDIYEEYDFEICIPSHSRPQTRAVLELLREALAEDDN